MESCLTIEPPRNQRHRVLTLHGHGMVVGGVVGVDFYSANRLAEFVKTEMLVRITSVSEPDFEPGDAMVTFRPLHETACGNPKKFVMSARDFTSIIFKNTHS